MCGRIVHQDDDNELQTVKIEAKYAKKRKKAWRFVGKSVSLQPKVV